MDEQLRNEYDDAAEHGNLEKASAEPCQNDADHERRERRPGALRGTEDGGERHHRQSDVWHVIEE